MDDWTGLLGRETLVEVTDIIIISPWKVNTYIQRQYIQSQLGTGAEQK